MVLDVDRAKFNQQVDPVDRTPEEQERRRALSLARTKAEVQRRMAAVGIAPGKRAYAQGSGAQYVDRGGYIPRSQRMREMLARNASEETEANSKRLAAAAKKKKEGEMRLIVRPMQKVLWTTGSIGAETVILPILAYPLWFMWKLAEVYKSKTKKDLGIPGIDDFVIPFSPIDWLQLIMGLFATLLIVSVMGMAIGLIGYFFLNQAEFLKFFSLLGEIFQLLFQ